MVNMLYVNKLNNISYEKWFKTWQVFVFVFEILLKVFVFVFKYICIWEYLYLYLYLILWKVFVFVFKYFSMYLTTCLSLSHYRTQVTVVPDDKDHLPEPLPDTGYSDPWW